MAKSTPQYKVVTAPWCLMSALASTVWRKRAWDALALHNYPIPLPCVCAFTCPHYNRYTFLCKARKWIYKYYLLCVELNIIYCVWNSPCLTISVIWKLGTWAGYLYLIASIITKKRESNSLVNISLRGSDSPSVHCFGREPRLLLVVWLS